MCEAIYMDFQINLPAKFNFNVAGRFVRPVGYLFLLFGLTMFSYSVKIFVDGQRVKSWVPYRAAISKAELKEHLDDEGRKSYSVAVDYVYQWRSKRYTGDRYRLHYHSSSGFQESQIIVQELLFAKNEGQPYPIFVDPERPQNSVVLNVVDTETQIVTLVLGLALSFFGSLASFRSSLFTQSKNASDPTV